jgi:2-polyprenyl-6-methoxyphenol hydroxylase-like FAD-dependent oxidoreductase
MSLVPCLPCNFTNNGRYMPIVLNEFEKVGILDDLLARSLRNTDGIYFRAPFAKGHQHLGMLSVAKLPKGVMKYDFVATNLGQHDLGKLLLEHAEKLETFEISWNHRFAGVQQDANGTKVCAVTPTGERFFQADYVVGCDGAGSSVRRALCIPFDGLTWQVLIIRFLLD